MAGVTFSLDIDRPIEHVFDFVTDTKRAPVWPPGLTHGRDAPRELSQLKLAIERALDEAGPSGDLANALSPPRTMI